MRSLLMLVLVVLAFLLVRWLAPTPSAAASEDPAAATARFLPPPEPAAPPEPEPEPDSRTEELASPAEPAWPTALVQVSGGQEDEIRLASALVHGTPGEVQEACAEIERDRALLLESFAWELAGERRMALSLSQKIDRAATRAEERELFEAALTGGGGGLRAAASPVELAMRMALTERAAEQALEARDHATAARAYSDLLETALAAPWPVDPGALSPWAAGLARAQREHRWNPRGAWPGVELTVERGDTLIALRLRFLADRPQALMCAGLIRRANRIEGHLQPGQKVRVPNDPVRVLVDLSARWALYYLGDEVAAAWPVGVGRPGEDTPPGDYLVCNKLENPPWMKEGQEPIPFGDPRNPLGTRWIGWTRADGRTSFGFHGTWEPDSIGHAASDGCVRFRNEDVEELFEILPEGAPIRVQE